MTYRKQVEKFATYKKVEIKEPNKIDFNAEIKSDTDILILAHQPGIGKTTCVMNYIKNNPKSVYFTSRHVVLEEMLSRYNFPFTWWEGVNRKCSRGRFKKGKNPNKLPLMTICSTCFKFSNCDYWMQVKKGMPIFAVFEHFPNRFVSWLDDNKSKKNPMPNIVFLDESKLLTTTYRNFDRREVQLWMELLDVPQYLCNSILNPQRNYSLLQNGWGQVQGCFNATVFQALNQGLNNVLEEALAYYPSDIIGYLEWANRYNDFSKELYSKPFWYNAFDLVKDGILPVFLDASFNLLWFNYMVECYEGEIGFGKDTVNVVYYGSEENKRYGSDATVVYNMRQKKGKGGWYPKSSWISFEEGKPRPSDSMKEWLKNHMKNIIDIFGIDNVGVISFKEVIRYLDIFNVDTLAFGDIRSSNKLEDKQVLIILGTFHGKEEHIMEHLHPLFYEDKINSIKERKLGKGTSFRSGSKYLNPYKFIVDPYLDKISVNKFEQWLEDKHKKFFFDDSPIADTYLSYNPFTQLVYPVWWLQKAIWDDEMYQAFHRNRGLRNSKIIFIYGWLPPHIINEFKIETIEPKDEDNLWDKLKKTHKNGLMYKILSDVIDGKSSSDITNEYTITKYDKKTKKSGRDTKVVTDLKDCIKKLKEEAKHPK